MLQRHAAESLLYLQKSLATRQYFYEICGLMHLWVYMSVQSQYEWERIVSKELSDERWRKCPADLWAV